MLCCAMLLASALLPRAKIKRCAMPQRTRPGENMCPTRVCVLTAQPSELHVLHPETDFAG
jgi:hypothetical protein